MSPAFNKLLGVVEYLSTEKQAQEIESAPFVFPPVFYRLKGAVEYLKIYKEAPEQESVPEVEYTAPAYMKSSPRTASPREESSFERYLRLKKQALLDRNHSLLQMIDPIKPT